MGSSASARGAPRAAVRGRARDGFAPSSSGVAVVAAPEGEQVFTALHLGGGGFRGCSERKRGHREGNEQRHLRGHGVLLSRGSESSAPRARGRPDSGISVPSGGIWSSRSRAPIRRKSTLCAGCPGARGPPPRPADGARARRASRPGCAPPRPGPRRRSGAGPAPGREGSLPVVADAAVGVEVAQRRALIGRLAGIAAAWLVARLEPAQEAAGEEILDVHLGVGRAGVRRARVPVRRELEGGEAEDRVRLRLVQARQSAWRDRPAPAGVGGHSGRHAGSPREPASVPPRPDVRREPAPAVAHEPPRLQAPAEAELLPDCESASGRPSGPGRGRRFASLGGAGSHWRFSAPSLHSGYWGLNGRASVVILVPGASGDQPRVPEVRREPGPACAAGTSVARARVTSGWNAPSVRRVVPAPAGSGS